MEPGSAAPLFIYLQFDEGEILLNLRQIVQVHSMTGDQITLEMSNGKSVTIHGPETITRIAVPLSQYAILPEEVPFAEFLANRDKN